MCFTSAEQNYIIINLYDIGQSKNIPSLHDIILCNLLYYSIHVFTLWLTHFQLI